MSTSSLKLLRQAEHNNTLRRQTFPLEDIQDYYAPRAIYDNADGTCIIHPLPTEGKVTIQIAHTQYVDRHGRLINPIHYIPSHDKHICELFELPRNQEFYTLFGHLTRFDDQTPLTDIPSRFRLSVDPDRLNNSDAVHIIIPRRHPSPSWPSTTVPPIFPSLSIQHFSRLIISPLESYDFWLLSYGKYLRAARQSFTDEYRMYILNSI